MYFPAMLGDPQKTFIKAECCHVTEVGLEVNDPPASTSQLLRLYMPAGKEIILSQRMSE